MYLKGITLRNKLSLDISNVSVLYAQSDKGTGVFSYAFNWAIVDVETKENVRFTQNIHIGEIMKDKEKSVYESIPYEEGLRGYWQVYFTMGGRRYKIDKNNAQANIWQSDIGTMVEITVRNEESGIRIDFVFASGNAYFYARRM